MRRLLTVLSSSRRTWVFGLGVVLMTACESFSPPPIDTPAGFLLDRTYSFPNGPTAEDLYFLEASKFDIHVVEIINARRAEGHDCGSRSYPPTEPLKYSLENDRRASIVLLTMHGDGIMPAGDMRWIDPAYVSFHTLFEQAWSGEGQILYAFDTQSAEEIVDMWMAAPEICDFLSSDTLEHAGIAHAFGAVAAEDIGVDLTVAYVN